MGPRLAENFGAPKNLRPKIGLCTDLDRYQHFSNKKVTKTSYPITESMDAKDFVDNVVWFTKVFAFIIH